MNAAIYARKSTKQDDVAEEAKSVPRQVNGARAFIKKKEWHLDESCVYTDDGVSGALFENRAEFQRMMRDAALRAFHALVFFDLDRFGRDAQKTMVALNTLADLDIEIWDYSKGRAIDLDSFETRLPTILQAEFAEQNRNQIRKHTREALLRKFELGLVAGCRIFGYTNDGPKGNRVRVVNKDEAAVVREIYERYARGEGYRQIAWALNKRGVPSPRAQRGRPAGWEPSTIRGLLDRRLYRGEDVYGRSVKMYGRELRRRDKNSKREKAQVRRPEDKWLKRDAPELRIIDEALAEAVRARRDDRASRYLRATSGRLIGGPSSTGAKYLLSGMLRCPCGAGFEALKGGNWRHRGAVYVCAARRRKGPDVCAYDLAFPIEQTDGSRSRGRKAYSSGW